MTRSELLQLSTEALWALHHRVADALTAKINAEKKVLEERLAVLGRGIRKHYSLPGRRRPYPPVLPKFRNPDNPAETWAGRGKRPRWIVRQLNAGRSLEELTVRSIVE